MVAPDEPVPDSRTTIRLPLEKRAYRPCLDDTDPSRSVYEKFPASVTVRSNGQISTFCFSGKNQLGILPPILLPTKSGFATKS